MKREFCDHDEDAQNRNDEVPIGGTIKLSANTLYFTIACRHYSRM